MADFSEAIESARTAIGCVSHARPLLSIHRERGQVIATRWLDEPAPPIVPSPLRGCLLATSDTVRPKSGTGESGFDVVSYFYALVDRSGVESIAFHWHPAPRFAAPVRPHVHVSAALRPRQPNGERGLVPLDKRHLPTGPVSLADVVAMPIEEFGAEPLAPGWRKRLELAALG